MRGSTNLHFSDYGELNFSGMEHAALHCRSVTIGQPADGYGDVTLFLTPAQLVQIRDHFTMLAAGPEDFTPSEIDAIHAAMKREEAAKQSAERGE